MVVRFDYAGTRVMFTGNAEHLTDAPILAWGERLHSDLLKVAHHGSRTWSTPAFVSGVDPDIAIISVWLFNKFNHPADVVMELHRRSGTRIHRMDRCGAVLVTLGGTRSVEPVLDEGC